MRCSTGRSNRNTTQNDDPAPGTTTTAGCRTNPGIPRPVCPLAAPTGTARHARAADPTTATVDTPLGTAQAPTPTVELPAISVAELHLPATVIPSPTAIPAP
jgi:hypothetical protein